MTKNLFGNLLENDGFYRADTIVEELAAKIPNRSPFYSTSPMLSFGSSVGYLPGTMELLYGPKSSGKTMIVLDRMKNALMEDPESIAVFVDAEMNFEYESTIRWMVANGVPTNRVLLIRDVCIKKIYEEHLLEKVQKELMKGNIKVSYCAQDSIQAMSTLNIPQDEKQLEALKKKGGHTKQDYGARANYLSRIFPFYRMFCRDWRIFTTFIGQARSGGEDRHGNPIWVTNGGEALYHEVQYRTFVNRWDKKEHYLYSDQQSVMGGNIKSGHRIKFIFEKNKMGEGQDREGYCDIEYMKGIVNVESELIVLCSKLGIVEQGGAWFTFDNKKFNGINKFAEYLQKEKDVYHHLFSMMMMRASSEDVKVKFDEKVDPETGEIINE